jgi:Ala-tRNA(Pro) deacylase
MEEIEGGHLMICELHDFLIRERAPFVSRLATAYRADRGRPAKVVILRDGDAYALAVLPAAAALELTGFRRRIGRYGLAPAEESDFRGQFPEFGAGPLPPFGRLFAIPVYLDRALAEEAELIFESGANRDVISMPMNEYVRVERPAIAPLAHALRAA